MEGTNVAERAAAAVTAGAAMPRGGGGVLLSRPPGAGRTDLADLVLQQGLGSGQKRKRRVESRLLPCDCYLCTQGARPVEQTASEAARRAPWPASAACAAAGHSCARPVPPPPPPSAPSPRLLPHLNQQRGQQQVVRTQTSTTTWAGGSSRHRCTGPGGSIRAARVQEVWMHEHYKQVGRAK